MSLFFSLSTIIYKKKYYDILKINTGSDIDTIKKAKVIQKNL